MSSELAVVLQVKPSQAKAAVEQLLQEQYHWTDGLEHADIHQLNEPEETLKIEDVRQFLNRSGYAPYQGEWQYYLMYGVDTASIPAQNALLKVLEEPPSQTRLILTATQADRLLPTIRSRVQLVSLTQQPDSENLDTPNSEPAVDFAAQYHLIQNSGWAELITSAEKYQDREAAQDFIQGLLHHLHQHMVSQPQRVLTQTQLLTHQQILTETLKLLEKNTNVRLTVEACFFSLKDAQTYPQSPKAS